ncbi:MAG: alpha-2-macroglobulin [Elusimicrobia bacterium]|nr:alpha-2-macroglobulin [Elusimicrobiota bacterium]
MTNLPGISASLLAVLAASPAWAGPGIEAFHPVGVARDVRQVTARFAEPMVPFGDPGDRAEPFMIDCPANGSGRWADGRNWVFDFDADLQAGLRCRFELKSGVRTLAGNSVPGPKKFEFSTGGPAVRATRPYEGDYGRIAEDQVFILRLDAPAAAPTVLKHASFMADGINEKIPVRLVDGSERRRLLAAAHEEDQAAVTLVQAKQAFPANAVVRLVWGKGVATDSGVATDADQTLTFKTRPEFAASLTCERVEAREGCLPFKSISVEFSEPVAWPQARKAFIMGPGGQRWTPKAAKADAEDDEAGPADETSFVGRVVFPGPFPAKAELKVHLPPGLKDETGRSLSNESKFPLDTRTSDLPPLAKFPADFGIIELQANPVLPVTLRAVEPRVRSKVLKVDGREAGPLEAIRGRLARVTAEEPAAAIMTRLSQVLRAEREKPILSSGRDILVPKPNGADAFEVVGIPLKEPGFYVVELESPRLGASLLGKEAPMYVAAAALVTNLSVHFKWGRESSLAWVTTLDRGLPVQAADVTVHDCAGAVLWRGRTAPTGVARIPALPLQESLPSCSYGGEWDQRWRLMVQAKAGEDRSFTLDSWNDGIEPWRFDLPFEYRQRETVLRRTVFDRQLLRAGETVHMKHFMRRQDAKGFSLPDRSRWPKQAVVEHLGSEQEYSLPLSWAADGTAVSDWAIPKEAKLGSYRVSIPDASGGSEDRWVSSDEEAGSFRVEQFRVPLLQGSIQPPAQPLVGAKEAPLQLLVRYLAGGAARGLAARLRTRLEPRGGPEFADFPDWSFANGPASLELDARRRGEPAPEVRTQDLNLDSAGSARVLVDRLPSIETPMDLASELEFRDPNGEVQTVSARVPLWPTDRVVGLKPDSWAVSKEKFKFAAAVATISGKPVAGAPVVVRLLERRVTSHRKRLVGGFYAYEHADKLVDHGVLCQGATDALGRLACEAVSPASGSLILEAEAQDSAGRKSTAHAGVWVAGRDDWWFDVSDNDRMDVLPERKRYEPGETAVLQVRMPFRKAVGLVTVEREGVLDAFVQPLSGKSPAVRLPVKGSYAPNVFVSVLAVRGRAGQVQPTALVDLGRPAYRLGLTELKVGWKAHELKVTVATDRAAYKVREKVRVNLDAGRGTAEVAVAAVDEGLLELMPNKSWDLLTAMMGRRDLAVRTATAQMHVVGKRHFGLKAIPAGGGGGRQTTRELFDTLLYWNARVPLGPDGRASIEIPLNDSVTGFRIAAVASAGAGLFGTGQASVRATQDLTIFSGLPPVVREGDRFKAVFTLRNASDRPLEAKVSARIDGLARTLETFTVALSSGEAKDVSWDVTAPGAGDLVYEATALAGSLSDRIKVSQKVVPAVPVRVLQATISSLEKPLQMPVEAPKDAEPGRGGVRVSFSPSVVGDITGLLDYMRSYPYGCLEQRTSKAVALMDTELWRRAMAGLPAHLDGDGLAKYFPSSERGSDVLTAYLLSIADEAGWDVPAYAREKMQAGLKAFVEGKVNRGSGLATVDLSLRKLAAIEALSRGGLAEAKMLDSIQVEPDLWPTSAVLDWVGVLKRLKPAGADKALASAREVLRSRIDFQGTTMGFSTQRTDGLWWLMVSADLNAVRAVLAALDWPDLKEDMPRLMRGALGRQQRGHWDLTTANAWGRLAIEKFRRRFEGEPVAGRSHADLGGQRRSVDWIDSADGGAVEFAWPGKRSSLAATHQGPGRPWAVVQSMAAVPLRKPFSSGYKIKKTVRPVEQKRPGRWSLGDIARVRLEVEAQADRTWVVVDDPIPAGSAILGTGLGRDSALSTREEKNDGETWPAYQERSFEAFRSYYEFVPKGAFSVEYTLRLNNPGVFRLPVTRAEALYSPESFGEIPNADWEVLP